MFESNIPVDLTDIYLDRYRPEVSRRSDYRIELTACFTFSIEETVSGPAGLTRVRLEEVIDRNWWWISGSTDVLLESSWELEAFEEIPGDPDTPS